MAFDFIWYASEFRCNCNIFTFLYVFLFYHSFIRSSKEWKSQREKETSTSQTKHYLLFSLLVSFIRLFVRHSSVHVVLYIWDNKLYSIYLFNIFRLFSTIRFIRHMMWDERIETNYTFYNLRFVLKVIRNTYYIYIICF